MAVNKSKKNILTWRNFRKNVLISIFGSIVAVISIYLWYIDQIPGWEMLLFLLASSILIYTDNIIRDFPMILRLLRGGVANWFIANKNPQVYQEIENETEDKIVNENEIIEDAQDLK